MMVTKHNPLICAVDLKDVNQAVTLCRQLAGTVGLVKLGLEFFTINGASGVAAVKDCGAPVFLDLKFHDIPNTVAQAVRSAVSLGVDMLTIHAIGGKTMMMAAHYAAKEEAARIGIKPPMILGVTVLTSMDNNDLQEVGVEQGLLKQVISLAKLAKESGLDGVVCSPLEIEILKSELGKDFKLIVPGIRPANAASGDQKRVLTPKEAVQKGADYIVVGRPITQAADCLLAAKEIMLEI